MHPRSQHVTAAAVALASFGLGLDQGGFSTGFIAGASFVIWSLVLVGVGLRLLPRAAVPRDAVIAGIVLALLAAWTALSWGWASDNGAVFVEIVRVLSYLGLFVLIVIVSGDEGPRPWLAGLAIGLLGIVVLALANRFDPTIVSGGLAGSRLNYPIGYWNALAACAAMTLALLAWFSVLAESAYMRAAAAAALPLPGLVIFLTGSRGGLAAAALAVILVLAFTPRRFALLATLFVAGAAGAALVLFAHSQSELVDGLIGPRATDQGHWLFLATLAAVALVGVARYRLDALLIGTSVSPALRRGALIVGLIALIGLVAAEDPVQRYKSFKQPPAAVDRLVIGAHFRSDNGSGRYQFWGAALDALAAHPVDGVGAGQYKAWWNQHGSIYWVLEDAHSLLFETAAELGAIGLVLVLGFLGLPAWVGWKRRRGQRGRDVGALLALYGAGVLSASIDWMWEIPAAFGPVILAAALLTGPATSSAAPAAAGAARNRRPRILLGASVLLCGWIALVCSGDMLLARVNLDRSQTDVSDKQLARAADAANTAVALQPWAAQPRFQLALIQEEAGDLGAARSTLREAAERAPEDWQIWFLRSRVEAEAGDLESARASYERALTLNPRSPIVLAEPDFLR